jgi:peptide/nickel transport system substrate-binding protein/dipeptide transport system substrate-binding protein
MTFSLSACSEPAVMNSGTVSTEEAGYGRRFLVAVDDEPDTVDFQCTTIHYTVALNAFDRLVEMAADDDGNVEIKPALAESWELSDDGCSYTFKLREGVKFSNGSPLTSSDVLYTFTRLLTYPESCNQDIIMDIKGAALLRDGETDQLEGFQIINDQEFVITLEQPVAAFLACISMPAASILDEETTEAAGDRFGKDPAATVGTGPFVLEEWEPKKGMKLVTNPDCWEGVPNYDGLDLRFLTESEEQKQMFEDGELDYLDLDEMGDTAEYFIRGDIYQDKLYEASQIGIIYITLNEAVEPLNDVRVRKAMQLALDREALLNTVYSGRGEVENGIYPHGLIGYNPDLPEIPYDPKTAIKLLAEAGYPDGFELNVTVRNTSTQWDMARMKMAVSMWKDIGIKANINIIDESEFMDLRKAGKVECYTATWTADYNDPDNFIFTFFGNTENTTNRSLCYPNQKVMDRVRMARTIVDEDERIKEYQDLEKTIVQDDAAWIPLLSRKRYYVIGDRIKNFHSAWNGSVKTVFRYMELEE